MSLSSRIQARRGEVVADDEAVHIFYANEAARHASMNAVLDPYREPFTDLLIEIGEAADFRGTIGSFDEISADGLYLKARTTEFFAEDGGMRHAEVILCRPPKRTYVEGLDDAVSPDGSPLQLRAYTYVHGLQIPQNFAAHLVDDIEQVVSTPGEMTARLRQYFVDFLAKYRNLQHNDASTDLGI